MALFNYYIASSAIASQLRLASLLGVLFQMRVSVSFLLSKNGSTLFECDQRSRTLVSDYVLFINKMVVVLCQKILNPVQGSPYMPRERYQRQAIS